MSNYLQITADNAASFIGKTVEFNWGPMHGSSELYTVERVVSSRWGTEVVAINADGAEKLISGFTKLGIGAHLVEAQ